MKFNWGTGIVLALAGFISFIMFFFIKGHYVKQDDLVSEEYYDEGLQHDERETWVQNAKNLSGDLMIEKLEDGNVNLVWPEELQEVPLSGEIKFLRPNNANMDVILSLENENSGSIAFTSGKFLRGNYRFKAKIIAGDKTYYWDRNYSY